MQLRDAVTTYFAGERAEMMAILVGALVAVGGTGMLWLRVRDGFATGLVITTGVAALLLAGTAAGLLIRDGRAAPALVQAVSTPATAEPAIAREAARIDVVVRNYPTYRYVATGLLALALAGLLVTSRGWVHGAAMGLMLLAAAQVMIDHYSERRARTYAERLVAG